MPDWRSGRYLSAIVSTENFGHPLLKKILDRRPSSYALLSMTLILLEVVLAVSFLLPLKLCLVLLMGGLLLHGGIAVIMGFNTFFWTFLATYPALYFLCSEVHVL